MRTKAFLSDSKKKVEGALRRYLPRRGKLGRVMRYSVFAGGKRFRPALCLAAARALGKDPARVIPIACAIEMLHAFTLIHDDLPAMDDSDFRRGKPACHRKFDEATAILAGDALNTLAFEVLARETGDARVSVVIGKALQEVVEGQVMDLESEGRKVSLRRLRTIHRKKTAALLSACVGAPAIHLGASKKQVRALNAYARHLGLAFQIADDILDATSTRKKLGKPVKADIKKGFPYLVGLEKSKKLADQEKNVAIAALKIFGKKANILREIAEFVLTRRS